MSKFTVMFLLAESLISAPAAVAAQVQAVAVPEPERITFMAVAGFLLLGAIQAFFRRG